ncbi:mucin-binding protein [Pediococcus argentinicus]|uniref:Mucin binding domain-containing protein n=1 Tax=Pediococcus argentinicus TaxID=480391 RepID=A0A0R2NIW7_9LACO|nr:hypothetical protein [Pediococcus argentinicus]KRO25734.1 hypothetical protein IV88_GL001497 [Pediococcus argentinicus]NKZ21900.1 hypothetical protein [Pediococcus argentinicus]GEP19069.1 hypothetical protein LSA03_04530 [Pediococcus argentinicus]
MQNLDKNVKNDLRKNRFNMLQTYLTTATTLTLLAAGGLVMNVHADSFGGDNKQSVPEATVSRAEDTTLSNKNTAPVASSKTANAVNETAVSTASPEPAKDTKAPVATTDNSESTKPANDTAASAASSELNKEFSNTYQEKSKPQVPQFDSISYRNDPNDASAMIPPMDKNGNPSLMADGSRAYPIFKYMPGWIGLVWYQHKNKQHDAGWLQLTPVDANDLSAGYNVPWFEPDLTTDGASYDTAERIDPQTYKWYYKGEPGWDDATMGMAMNTYYNYFPDIQKAEIVFFDKTDNKLIGTKTLTSFTGNTSDYDPSNLIQDLGTLGYVLKDSDFEKGFKYDSTDNTSYEFKNGEWSYAGSND